MRNVWYSKLSKWLGLGLILLGITFSTTTFANQDQQPEGIRTVIEQARAAWVALDADALAQLFTPDGELIVPGQRWQGQERIRKEVARFAQQFSNVRIDLRRVIVEGNQAAIEWYYEDTEAATGLRNKADDVIVVDFQGNQISRWREYPDAETPTSNPL